MKLLHAAVILMCAVVGIAIGATVLHLPAPPVRLTPEIGAMLGSSGVSSAVTAVLLNFRGYDTLLEIAVLLLALIGVLEATSGERSIQRRLSVPPQPFLEWVARAVVPLMVLVAGYLLWAGSHRPGGAFQASAVLAAAVVLLYLAGRLHVWPVPNRWIAAGMVSGFLLFLAIAAAGLSEGALLQYPLQSAGLLILLIEGALAVSLGLVLAGLFLWLPDEYGDPDE